MPFVMRAICAVTVGVSAAVGVSAIPVAAPDPVVASAPLAAGITKEQRGDPDLVDPSYWRAVGTYLKNRPALPEEAEDFVDDVDLNA